MKLQLDRLRSEAGPQWRDQAMEAIWDAWYRPLAAYIRTSFRLEGETEDLMQDIMLKVYRSLDAYDSHHALSTWLYAIARNTCLDWLQKARLPVASLDAEPSGGPLTETRVIERAVEGEVDQVLAVLDPQDRSIAWLAFYEKAPYRRIAEVHGIALHTVKNRVFALRRQLKAALEDYHA